MKPHSLAFDGAGNLYLGDTGNDVVKTFVPDQFFLSLEGGQDDH